ncbi:MAG: hypothetical protein NC402_01155 [Prevotella sp.]|nr:hypothetical protein [Prevotella sp.]MCM1075458.1 hypothetical protein [Ruminococcus sp.]
MMKPLYISILALGLGVVTQSAHAQELSGSLSAVGDYKAEIRTHNRLSGLPQRLSFNVPEGSLPLAIDALTVSDEPLILRQTAGTAIRNLPNRYRGYASLLAGSYLNASLSAGYRFIDNDETIFGAWLQHSSSSLYRPETSNQEVEADRRKIYDETICVYGSHIFPGSGTLNAAVAYRLGYFNYFNNVLTPVGEPVRAKGQTLNDFKMSAYWKSVHRSNSLFLNGEFSYRYFGYRRLFAPYTDAFYDIRPPRENTLTVALTPGYDLGENGNVSLNLRSQTMFYIHPHTVSDIENNIPSPFIPGFSEMRTYGLVSVAPGYSYTQDGLSLHAGVKADLTWNPVSPDKFKTFHIAPDVALSYAAGKTNLYLNVGGGVTPNTLASRSELDMYQSPALLNTLPQYSPIDATLGVRLGSFSGFSAGVHASYAIADNTPTSGWYPYWYANMPLIEGYTYTPLSTLSLKGFSLGADVKYALGSLLDVNGAVSYQRQSGKNGYFNGIDRPRWIMDASADIYPIKGLCFGVSYQYRGVRNIYMTDNLAPIKTYAPDHNFTDTPGKGSLLSHRLPDVYDLGVHARYTLMQRYTFSVAVDNILGCDNSFSPLMPEPGLTVTGGVSVLF